MASRPKPKIVRIQQKQLSENEPDFIDESEIQEDQCSELFHSVQKIDLASYNSPIFASKKNHSPLVLPVRIEMGNIHHDHDDDNDQFNEKGFKKIDTLHGKSSTADTITSNLGPSKITKLFKVGSAYLKGIVQNAAGDTFEGEIVGGMAKGPGVLNLSSGITFKGFFKDDLKHGHSEEELPNGIKIKSIYVNGKRHGQFETMFPDGSIFKGYFENGEEHSLGEYIDRNGTVFKGHFKKGKIEGYGTANYPNGNKYDGDFLGNKRHGSGTFF